MTKIPAQMMHMRELKTSLVETAYSVDAYLVMQMTQCTPFQVNLGNGIKTGS